MPLLASEFSLCKLNSIEVNTEFTSSSSNPSFTIFFKESSITFLNLYFSDSFAFVAIILKMGCLVD